MTSSPTRAPHALIVPAASAQGHINGALQLAHALVPLGFKVSFVYFSTSYSHLPDSTRLALGNQLASPPAHGSGSVSIHVVQDGFAPGDLDKFFLVTPEMKDNLQQLIRELQQQSHPPTCLISDSFTPYTVEVAKRAGIPRVELWTSNALAHLLITHLEPLYSEGVYPASGSSIQGKMLSHIPGLPPFSSELMPPHLASSDTSNPMVKLFLEVGSRVKDCERLLINSIQELEPTAFIAFEAQGIPAYAIGPLPIQTKKHDAEVPDCVSWLNTQVESSVIYVAFGSVAGLSAVHLQELAMGLEASEHPFLWVVREGASERLPSGFLERTRGRGLIIGWAPQVEVLAHKAIGGFLSHTGWNSTLESMWAGVPMLCCPLFAEQGLNTHYLCNVWGAGLKLGRTGNGGLERSLVESGVRALLQSEAGMKARSKAQEMMRLARKTCQPGGQSLINLQKFYDDMRELC